MVRAQLLSRLSGVAPATVRELTSAAVTIELPPRTVIYDAGDKCTGLYVIIVRQGEAQFGSLGRSMPRVVSSRSRRLVRRDCIASARASRNRCANSGARTVSTYILSNSDPLTAREWRIRA